MANDPLGHSLIHHFSQANPFGEGQDDVPALLRRVAATIEKLDRPKVFDLVLHNEITENGDWFNLVYYTLPGDPDAPTGRATLRSV